MNALTPKQENFAQLVVELGSLAEAYRRAYSSKGKAATCQRQGHELMKNSKISARVQEIRDALAEKELWKRLDSVSVLANIARQGEKDADRVSAVKALNSMHGWDKQVIDHTSSDGSMTPKAITAVDPAEAARQYRDIMAGNEQ